MAAKCEASSDHEEAMNISACPIKTSIVTIIGFKPVFIDY